MTRRALFAGALLVVVAAAIALGAALRGGDEAASPSWSVAEPVQTIAPPSTPSGARKPAFPPMPSPSAAQRPAPIPPPEPTTESTWDLLTEFAEDEGAVPVIVTLRPRVTPEGALGDRRRVAQQARIEAAGTRLVDDLEGTAFTNLEQFEAVPLVTLDATPEALAELRNSPEVVSVVQDVPLPLPLPIATSAAEEREWGEADEWWHIGKTEMETAWNGGYDGRGQTVAVLDTGVQSDHEWLQGKVIAEACYSYAGNCPGNRDATVDQGSGNPCTYAQSCGHGTHVAHDAAGKYGVARGANIIAIQVFSRVTDCEDWEGDVCARSYTSDQLKGLQHVYSLRDSHKIAAVNMSLGDGDFADYCDAADPTYASWVKTLASYGIAVVIATGNDSQIAGIGQPACHRDAIAAGASSLDPSGSETVAAFSNRAPGIFNLLAPGEFICSAWMDDSARCGDGTSYAAPLVAGAFATLKQVNPQASVTAMRDSIVCSGTPISDGSAVRRVRLDVWRAVNALKNGC